MQIYDISQEVFGCAVYPGDPAPRREILSSMEEGAVYNLTAFSMCAHNGTHLDAPRHFLRDGGGVDAIPLEKTVGFAYVCTREGRLAREDARTILSAARAASSDAAARILLRGSAEITEEAARVFADAGTHLIGCESQSIGPLDAPMAVHRILLAAEVVLLEGLRLSHVSDGVYFLHAAPLLLGGADGAPCRATLIKF